jgi:hypothetical protein
VVAYQAINCKMGKFVLILLICGAFLHEPLPLRAETSLLQIGLTDAKYARTELYFGLSRKGGSNVSEREFQDFLNEVVTPRFPNGLTIIDARGQWRENDLTITKEPSKVVILFYTRKERRDAGRKIEEIRAEYKRRFSQQSVLRVDQTEKISVMF